MASLTYVLLWWIVYEGEIKAAAGKHGIPESVIKAIIATESGWNPRAYLEERGGDGSIGVMQIRLSTARAIGYAGSRENLFLPQVNIYYGTAFLADLVKRMGETPPIDWAAVASAYNGGYRPHLGFGRRLTVPKKVCLRRDPKTGRCTFAYDAKPGQFGNQPYVDKFLRFLERYQGLTPSPEAAMATALSVPLLVAMVKRVFKRVL